MEKPKKKSNKTCLIIAIVGAVLILCAVVVGVAVFLLGGASLLHLGDYMEEDYSTDTSIDGFEWFESDDQMVKIPYPEGWTVEEGYGGTIAFFSSPADSLTDSFSENVGIGAQDISDTSLTLDDFTDVSIDELYSTFTDMVVIDSGEYTLSGNDGYSITYTTSGNGISAQIWQVWTVVDDTVYILTFTSEEDMFIDYMDDVQPMFENFKINN